MKLDLESLEVLDAVIRTGGVAPAAEALNRTRSAVSYHLRQTEGRLGVALLDRSGYRLALTDAGRTLLDEARRLLAQARHIESLAGQFASGWEPRLTVIFDGIIPLAPLFSALKTLSGEGAPTNVVLKVEFLGGVQHRFEQDGADLMLVKDCAMQPNLEARALPRIECVLCAAPDHPLARPGEVTLSALQADVELTIQDSSGLGNDRHRFGGERLCHLSDFNAKREALLMGLGFGWMPLHMAAHDLAAGALAEVRYRGGSRYEFTPQVVWRSDRPPGRAGRRLVELFLQRIA